MDRMVSCKYILPDATGAKEHFMPLKERKKPEKRNETSTSEMGQRLKTRPFIFIGTIFILVIVVVAFVFVPIMVPAERGIGDFSFGYYNREPIRMVHGNFFHHAVLMRQHGQISANPDNMPLMHHIWHLGFQETVIRLGMLDEVRRAGFVVPDNLVDREIARRFQTEDGRFDAAAYRALDSATRMSIWRQAQEDLATWRHLQDVGSLRISSSEREFIGAMASPLRTFNAAIFPLSSYPDSQVAEHALANPAPFRATHLSRITANSESEARDILGRIQRGETTFEEEAAVSMQDVFTLGSGDLGMRFAFEMTSEIWNTQIREEIINLAEGEISDVVSVWLGAGMNVWGFYRANQSVSPADVSDPDQVQRIRNHIMSINRGIVEDWVIAEAVNFAAQVRERDFDIVAAEGNVLRRTFGPIPINFGNSTLFPSIAGAGVPEIQEAGENLTFWTEAFGTPLHTPSNYIVSGDNVIILFPIEETQAEAFETDPIESFYLSRVMEHLQFAHQVYFLTNERLSNNFDDTFYRMWGWRPPPQWFNWM